MTRVLLVCLCAAFAVVGHGTAVAGNPPAPPTNDDCLMCHGDASAARGDGGSVVVEAGAFGASIHGQSGIACVDCHTDLAAQTEWPHAEALKPAQCASCHAPAVALYEKGVHALARRSSGTTRAATCADCHGTHDMLPKADPASRTHHMTLLETCGKCHGDEAVIERGTIAIGNVVDQYRDSIHGRALLKRGLTVAPTCNDCHGSHDIRTKRDPESRAYRTVVPATCGQCHEGIGREYSQGVHGQHVANGSSLAPVCTDCHSAHQIRRAEVESWRLEVVRECGTCHEQSARTFADTFHGQVTSLGFTRVAACADCHGAHAIFPKSDERSSVSPGNVTATCKTCHEQATASFAKFDPHADPHNRERNGLLYYTTQFMQMLLAGVFAFFGLHTALWFGRGMQVKARDTTRRRAPVIREDGG